MRLSALSVLVMFMALLGLASVHAQEGKGAEVKAVGVEKYLTDGLGRSLYIYLEDTRDTSTCTGVCADNWPPFTTDGEPVATGAVNSQLLGTLTRADGSAQVTYNGWPLYHYAYDVEEGTTFGHRLGGVFYLVETSGVRVEQEAQPLPEPVVETAEEVVLDELEADVQMTQGADLFASNCAACHGNMGQGLVGPGLVGSMTVERASSLITTVLFGRLDHGMPAFEDQLTDSEIAALATFVRNSWSNSYGPITSDQVAALR